MTAESIINEINEKYGIRERVILKGRKYRGKTPVVIEAPVGFSSDSDLKTRILTIEHGQSVRVVIRQPDDLLIFSNGKDSIGMPLEPSLVSAFFSELLPPSTQTRVQGWFIFMGKKYCWPSMITNACVNKLEKPYKARHLRNGKNL